MEICETVIIRIQECVEIVGGNNSTLQSLSATALIVHRNINC